MSVALVDTMRSLLSDFLLVSASGMLVFDVSITEGISLARLLNPT